MDSTFASFMANQYGWSEPSLELGRAAYPPEAGQPQTLAEVNVRMPLALGNRHGLVAGATGTGKTRTLQGMAEQLSLNGVPVFLADIKGDLSGLAQPGAMNPKLQDRCSKLGINFQGREFPVEYLSLSGKNGIPLRATVSSFGPILLSKVLGLNETQQSSLTMVFKFCDDRQLPLLDFSDLRAVLTYLTGDGAAELKAYGGLSSTSVGVLLRKMVELEAQGGDKFFGEPEFDPDDLLRTAPDGRGVISILEIADLQDRPMLFSTFMMWLLAALYRDLPERGDVDKPILAFFFDEAHFLFDDASKAFLDQLQQVVRLIRSKGVGVYFVTQTPKDVDEEVLAQLGHRVQHALRAFTPNDAKALKATVATFPMTKFYDLEETLTSLGIGEALITVLNPRGVPTSPVATVLRPPQSFMGPATPEMMDKIIRSSPLYEKYSTPIDRESARELLAKKMVDMPDDEPVAKSKSAPQEEGMLDKVAGVINSPLGRQIGREVVRGLFGLLGPTPKRRTRRRTGLW
ncbi:MAG: helicase HerA-like domain-containing protein [bacterium]